MKRLVYLAGRAEREHPNPSDGHRRVTAFAVRTALSNGAASDRNGGFVFATVLDGLSTNAAVFPQRALPMALVVVYPKLGSFRAA